MGAHIHFADIRAPELDPGTHRPHVLFLISPSVSPIFNNNPGTSILDLTPDAKVANLTWRFLDFQTFITTNKTAFREINPPKLYGIDLNSYQSVERMDDRLIVDEAFFETYARSRTGYSPKLEGLGKIGKAYDRKYRSGTICSKMYLLAADFNTCMETSPIW